MRKGMSLFLAAVTMAATVAGASVCEVHADGKELRFLDVSPSETRQKYYEETFAKFEEETGISVSYESVPWDDAANKITVLGASGCYDSMVRLAGTVHICWLGNSA